MADKIFVSVIEGRIKGMKKKSNFSSIEYYSFLGIPYAQPPVGQARFKDPVRIKPWKNFLDGTIEKKGCRQFSIFYAEITGSEDCLYNNIHTPELPKKGNPLKPVIVNIHPGAFTSGSADPSTFGSPDYVMHHDFVYVCISFRLHILGFLNLGLKECSGNQAIKDIVMSLEWIKDNISAFGGDPNNVTLMGSSSGASIVNSVMLSSRAQGLFHKAVLMGMYVTNPVLITEHENITAAFELAKSLGYDGSMEDRRKLLAFYKTVDIDNVIILKRGLLYNEVKLPVYPAPPFLPTRDLGENPVLPLAIDALVPSTARIPIMVGFAEHEAAVVFLKEFKSRLEKNFYSTLTQNVCGWGNALTEHDLTLIEKEVEQFYLSGEPTNDATLLDQCNIQTDIALSDVYDSLINVIAKDLPSSVYVYKFTFEGSIFTFKKKITALMSEPLNGTFHGDDYSYWSFIKDDFGKDGHNISPQTREVIEKFTKLISTFARNGDPNYEGLDVQWNPTSVENPCYMNINHSLELVEDKNHTIERYICLQLA